MTARLGERTDTSDADGQVISRRPVAVTDAQLQQALAGFRGDTLQVPSMYSALKHQGRPLYEYAREGIEVEREARPITVYALELLAFRGDEIELDVHCSKGTYIRTIVDDLGEVLGCGAHVTRLHRSQVARYPSERMVTLEQLQSVFEQCKAEGRPPREDLDPLLMPMDTAVSELPEVNMSEIVASYVNQGQAVQVPKSPLNGFVRMTVGETREFIGVGEMDDDGKVAPRRLVRIAGDDEDEE